MKNPEYVAELLAALKNECEYRFEFDAVAALAQSVKELPRVTDIDNKHQEFLGKTYTKSQTKRYWRGGKYLHRVVWSYYHGEIPDGYEIHHVDGNPANNNVENLQCISPKEHKEKHRQKPRPVFNICQNCGTEFFAAIPSKFCSPVCRARAHEKLERNRVNKICPVCKKVFSTRKRAKHEQVCCSHVCATTYMHIKRKSNLDI